MTDQQISSSTQQNPLDSEINQLEQIQNKIPFFDEETLQNLAISYKEYNEQQNQQASQDNNNTQFFNIDSENLNPKDQINESKLKNIQTQPAICTTNQQQPVQTEYSKSKDSLPQHLENIAPIDKNRLTQGTHTCCHDCIKKIRGKTCVCIVPASLRKQDISKNGCRTCQCKGCGDESNIKPELQRESKTYQQQPQQKQEYKKEVLQNGCCRECMKAFSKTGKSCLCQVPKAVRKFELPSNGCNICGCNGCNPGDLRKQQENYQKPIYQQNSSQNYNNNRHYSKRTPSYSRSHSGERRDSKQYRSRSRSHQKSLAAHTPHSNLSRPSQFGNKPQQQQQELLNFEQMNFQNFQNSIFGQYVQKTLSIFPPLMGFGIPERTPSYILGKPIENNE